MDSNSSDQVVAAKDASIEQISNLQAAANGGGVITVGMDPDIYKAAAIGEIEVLKTKLSENELQVQLTPKHNTALHIAAQFGEVQCVNWILNNSRLSSLLQRPNLKGDTPLHLAAREGHLKVVEALLSAAAKLPEDIETGTGAEKSMMRITNKEKDTAFHEAVRYDHSHVVELLIEKDPQSTYGANGTGISPLYMAAERGFTYIVRIIIEKSKETGTSPAYRGFRGRTALHAAVLCNDQEMTRQILDWNPALTREVDEEGWSPLHCAAERNCDRMIVKQLLEKSDRGVAYLGITDGKKTALHIASFHHHKDIIEELLSSFPDCCEQVDSDGRNVFHFAMMKKGDHDFTPGDYTYMRWWEVDKKACNNENLTAWDIISRAKEDISGKKDEIQRDFEFFMPETRDSVWKKRINELKKKRESKEYKEKYTSELQKQGETHLIVSALITTVTFAAGFTLPGGYKEDDGKAILSKKAAFRAFVVTDTIAMVSSLCAVFLHFFMTMRKGFLRLKVL